jgi:phosphatidylinositol 4-kinase
MFESEYFSLPLALVYLLKADKPGVRTYLVNKLFNYPPEEVAFYLPQLVILTLKHDDWADIQTYLLDMAEKSYLFAMNLYWHLHSKLDSRLYREKLDSLLHDCEMTLVNGVRPQRAKTTEPPPAMFPIAGEDWAEDENAAYTYKQHRDDCFLLQSKILYLLTGLSISLIDRLSDERDKVLRCSLQNINQVIEESRAKHQSSSPYIKRLFRGVVLPTGFCQDPDSSLMQVVRIPFDFSLCYQTKSRVPYKVYLEMVSIDEADSAESQQEAPIIAPASEPLPPDTDPGLGERRVEEIEKLRFAGLSEYAEEVEKAEQDGVELSSFDQPDPVPSLSDSISEPWTSISAAIRAASPYGSMNTWKLRAFIVKGEDDLRQELLAMQFIKKVSTLLSAAGINAYLRPYEIYVVSHNAGLIEYIPDTQSISSIHKKHPSLLSYYQRNWPETFPEAQKNFAESLAGYSLICYLLNVKDRHNGNILVDRQGHVIHIDFGFYLTSSPGGNINFETAPFKLTREMVELLSYGGNEVLQYFKILMFQGFLELRRRKEELILLVEMMKNAELMGCFVKEDRVLRELDERFHLNKTDEQCLRLVEDLVNQAKDNWRTAKYDSFQRYSNGIL